MRAIVLTSNSPRHTYFANIVHSRFELIGMIRECKGSYYKTRREASALIESHFEALEKAESTWFGESRWPSVPTLELSKGHINEADTLAWASNLRPDLIFLFGTSILSEEWLTQFPQQIINLHLGLSPYYRGSATLFWPIANNEIECLGSTIHLAEKRVDAGRILARIKPVLSVGDDYYTINYKTIKQSMDTLPDVATRYLCREIEPIVQNLHIGKTYRKADFNEDALLRALRMVGDGLTKQQVDNIRASKKCDCL